MIVMQAPQWLARFNKYVTNPVQKLWAGYSPLMAILEHVGRKSGKTFRTPLIVFDAEGGVAILLTYGPNRDWLKNITAAGGGRLKRYGRSFAVDDPRVMPKAEAALQVKTPWRRLFSLLPFDQAVLLRKV
jgi:deazaflavin-dependent oxidoreductase (nitroreductase family)